MRVGLRGGRGDEGEEEGEEEEMIELDRGNDDAVLLQPPARKSFFWRPLICTGARRNRTEKGDLLPLTGLVVL